MRLRQQCRRVMAGLAVLLMLSAPLTAGLRPVGARAEPLPAALYAVTDLGTLGGRNSTAIDINRQHQVVGWAETDPTTDDVFHAFLWEAGQMTNLGTLGGRSSMATGINDDGVIAGWAENSEGKRRAVLWQDGAIHDLGTLGGDNSGAAGINAQGQIVGSSEIIPGSDAAHAFSWDNGKIVDLGTSGGENSRATAINDHGQIVGFLENATGDRQAITWNGGEIAALAGDASYANALNSRARIAGGVDADGQPHAALWDEAGVLDLGTLGGQESYATGIDDAGRIVGGAFSVAEDMRAFVWEVGTMRDLGTLGGWRSSATAIGADGAIVGWAQTVSGDQRASLWTVVPAPAQPTATPAPERENLLFGSVQDIEGTSALAACAGAATWLAVTATNIDPLLLPLFPGSDSGSVADYRAALKHAQGNLGQRQPPPAAAALHAHLGDMLQHVLATTHDAGDSAELFAAVSADGQFAADLLELLAQSRHLKRDCNLVNSPQFFDATCYGIEAAEWYSRTYARWLAFTDASTVLQQEISAGALEDATMQAVITRATAEFEPFLQAQLAEETPTSMQRLQQHYVDLFALLTTMWDSVLSGQQSIDEARHAAAVMVTFAQREAARLDISCRN